MIKLFRKILPVVIFSALLTVPVFAVAQSFCTTDNECAATQKCDDVNNVCVNRTPVTPTPTPTAYTGQQTGGSVNNGNCGGDPKLEYRDGLCQLKRTCTAGSLACASSLSEIITMVIKYLLYFAGIIAVIFIIVGGYWYITSAGNEEQAEKGKNTLVNAVIGVVLVVLSYVIVSVVANTVNSGGAAGTNNGTANTTNTGRGVDNSSGGANGPIQLGN